MKKLKKLALWLMMLVLVFSLAACGEKEDDDSKKDRDRVEEREDDDEDEDDEDKDDEDDEDEDSEDEDKSKDDEDDKDEPEVTVEPQPTEEPEEETVSAKELLLEIAEASLESPMTSCTYTLGMDFGISMEGFSMEMAMEAEGNMVMSMEPYMSYTEMVMDMTVLGEQTTETSEIYMLEEDGEVVTYTYSSADGQWSKESSGMSVDEMIQQGVNNQAWLADKPVDEIVIDPELHTINGKEAYKISLALTGDEMQAVLENTGSMEDIMAETGMEGFDLTLINVPAVYYVDTTTHQVLQLDMNIEGMGELLTNMMKESFSQDPSMAGYEVDVTIGEFVMSYTNMGYEPVEMPEIPEEILTMQNGGEVEPGTEVDPGAVVDPGTVTDEYPVTKAGDVYTIEESGDSVDIVCQEGWTVTNLAYDTLSIENADTWQMVEYVIYTGATSDYFKDYVNNSEVTSAQEMGVYLSHGEGPAIGSFTTMEILCDGFNLYYAWAPVGDCMIYVTVIDFEGKTMEEALTPMLDWVQLDNVL